MLAVPIIALLIIAAVSLFVVRITTIALVMTGLSWDTASFQSYSAFLGVGFTTKETELVVGHPARRKIITGTMLAGNIGLTSALGALVVTIIDARGKGHLLAIVLSTLAGLAALGLIATWRVTQRVIDAIIGVTLKHIGVVQPADYALLLRFEAGYCASLLELHHNHPWVGKTLAENRIADQGMIVLGILREGGEYLGAPSGKIEIRSGDTVTLYGREDQLTQLSKGLPQVAASDQL